MKTQQGSKRLDDALAALDRTVLEALAANLMECSQAELELVQAGQAGVQPRGAADDGL